jgi:hypothetical protein
MTDESTRPGDVCPESRDADTPTAFQEACGMLGVRSHQENTLTRNKWFGKGWDAGIERDLGSEFYPTEDHVVPSTPDNVREAQLAFILGVTTGLIAESREYDSPCCLYGHGSRGGCPTSTRPRPTTTSTTDRQPATGATAWSTKPDPPRRVYLAS